MNDQYSYLNTLQKKINDINNKYLEIIKYTKNNRYVLSKFSYDENYLELDSSLDVISIELNNLLFSMENDIRMHNLFNEPHKLPMYQINVNSDSDSNSNSNTNIMSNNIKSKEICNDNEIKNYNKRVICTNGKPNNVNNNTNSDNDTNNGSNINNDTDVNKDSEMIFDDNTKKKINDIYDNNVKKIMPYLFMYLMMNDEKSIINNSKF